MPIRLECQSCATRIKVPDGTEGRIVKCPRCGHTQQIIAEPSETRVGREEFVASAPTATTAPIGRITGSRPPREIPVARPTAPPDSSGINQDEEDESSQALAEMAQSRHEDQPPQEYSHAHEDDSGITATEEDFVDQPEQAAPVEPEKKRSPTVSSKEIPTRPQLTAVPPPLEYRSQRNQQPHPPAAIPIVPAASPAPITPAEQLQSELAAVQAEPPSTRRTAPVPQPTAPTRSPQNPKPRAVPADPEEVSPKPRLTGKAMPLHETDTGSSSQYRPRPAAPTPALKTPKLNALLLLSWVLRILAFLSMGTTVKIFLITGDLQWHVNHRLMTLLACASFTAITWFCGEAAAAIRATARKK
jgi:predicted Zn finger-like uncharacterized protein